MNVVISAALVLVAATVINGARNKFTLKNNQYGDLLIAISEDVKEDRNMITQIQRYFNFASKDLFTATKRRAYFGNITILVPFSWTRNNEWSLASTESFERANIIIDKPNNKAQDNPYVNQPGKCGEPGKYMHLTPNYLMNRRVASAWGPIGRTIIHEFGHLRWGLFDEYPIATENDYRFYHSSDQEGNLVIEPVRCSKQTKGYTVHEVTGEPCLIDPTTSLYEEACTFLPDTNNPTAEASLMFWHFIRSTNSFCDSDPSNPSTYHNDEAPNKHNRLCHGRSQWDIIREHEDFADGNNSPIESNINTRPTFKVVQKGAPRVVLVIDTSGSMGGLRVIKAVQAATEYLLDIVEDGTSVGIVTFASRAQSRHDLLLITTDKDRKKLVDVLPRYATGGTCIGCGLLKAAEILEKNGQNAAGGSAFLLSDGEDNGTPSIGQVLPIMVEKGVIVDTVLYTQNADAQLLSLAAATGGMSFYSPDTETTTALKDAFTKTVTERSQKLVVVQVFGDTLSLEANETYSQNIYVDEDIGNKTEFVITWHSNNKPSINISIQRPNGTFIIPENSAYNDATKSVRISIPETAESGKWVLTIKHTGAVLGDTKNYALQVSATSRARDVQVKPITLESEINRSEVNFSDPSAIQLIVYATVTKEYTPVVDAEVEAIIETETKKFTQIMLDNGAGADTTKEDGIYSAYFLHFAGNGRYNVKVKVKGDSSITKLKTVQAGGQSVIDVNQILYNNGTTQNVTYTSVNTFSRETSSGSFAVINQPLQPTVSSGNGTQTLRIPDLYPPDAINDLRVIDTSYQNSTLTLRWTAVGDDLDQGQASSYDLRMHTSFQELRTNFDNGTAVNSSHLLTGDLTKPLSSGQIEIFKIQLNKKQENVTYIFAVKAIDDDNKAGSISNLAPAAFFYIPPEKIVGATTATPTTEKVIKDGTMPNVNPTTTDQVTKVDYTRLLTDEVILGLSLGATAVIVILVVIGVCCCLKLQAKKKVSQRREIQAHDNLAYTSNNSV